MAYRIYRCDDPGAVEVGLPLLPAVGPSATVSASVLIQILDAVLVNGYPGKAPAGWSKPHGHDGTRHIYQSQSVTGAAFRLSTAITETCAAPVSIMTNPNSLTTTNIIGTNRVRQATYAGGAWFIFADEKSFMIFCRGNLPALSLTHGQWTMFYFGEVENFPTLPDPYGVCAIGSTQVNAVANADFPTNFTLYTPGSTAVVVPPRVSITHSSAATQTVWLGGGPFSIPTGSASAGVSLASTSGKVLSSDLLICANGTLLSRVRGVRTLESAFWSSSNPLDTIMLDGKKYAIVSLYSTANSTLSFGVSHEAMLLVEVE